MSGVTRPAYRNASTTPPTTSAARRSHGMRRVRVEERCSGGTDRILTTRKLSYDSELMLRGRASAAHAPPPETTHGSVSRRRGFRHGPRAPGHRGSGRRPPGGGRGRAAARRMEGTPQAPQESAPPAPRRAEPRPPWGDRGDGARLHRDRRNGERPPARATGLGRAAPPPPLRRGARRVRAGRSGARHGGTRSRGRRGVAARLAAARRRTRGGGRGGGRGRGRRRVR